MPVNVLSVRLKQHIATTVSCQRDSSRSPYMTPTQTPYAWSACKTCSYKKKKKKLSVLVLTRALSKLQCGNSERHSDRQDVESLSLITSYRMVGQKKVDHPEAAESGLKQNSEFPEYETCPACQECLNSRAYRNNQSSYWWTTNSEACIYKYIISVNVSRALQLCPFKII